MSSFITAEENSAFIEFNDRIKNLEKQIRDIARDQQKIIEAVFLRFLQNGRWKVEQYDGGNLFLKPLDGDTESRMTELLMTGLSLDWHDNFYASARGLYIEGRVNDG